MLIKKQVLEIPITKTIANRITARPYTSKTVSYFELLQIPEKVLICKNFLHEQYKDFCKFSYINKTQLNDAYNCLKLDSCRLAHLCELRFGEKPCPNNSNTKHLEQHLVLREKIDRTSNKLDLLKIASVLQKNKEKLLQDFNKSLLDNQKSEAFSLVVDTKMLEKASEEIEKKYLKLLKN